VRWPGRELRPRWARSTKPTPARKKSEGVFIISPPPPVFRCAGGAPAPAHARRLLARADRSRPRSTACPTYLGGLPACHPSHPPAYLARCGPLSLCGQPCCVAHAQPGRQLARREASACAPWPGLLRGRLSCCRADSAPLAPTDERGNRRKEDRPGREADHLVQEIAHREPCRV
jgi:hypothetical protein